MGIRNPRYFFLMKFSFLIQNLFLFSCFNYQFILRNLPYTQWNSDIPKNFTVNKKKKKKKKNSGYYRCHVHDVKVTSHGNCWYLFLVDTYPDSSWLASCVSYYAVPLWLLQVAVPLRVLRGYSDATACAVASQPIVIVASEYPYSIDIYPYFSWPATWVSY